MPTLLRHGLPFNRPNFADEMATDTPRPKRRRPAGDAPLPALAAWTHPAFQYTTADHARFEADGFFQTAAFLAPEAVPYLQCVGCIKRRWTGG